MLKHKPELILLIILIPILAYIVLQAYNTYFKQPGMDIEELEKAGEEKPAEPIPGVGLPEKPIQPPTPRGTLDYTGYTERDPLRPALPITEKVEKPPEIPRPVKQPKKRPVKKILPPEEIKIEPPKEIILPAFIVTGVVWGKESPRAIIDNQVYKIGDVINGAKILEISQKGILMVYEGKEFWVTISR